MYRLAEQDAPGDSATTAPSSAANAAPSKTPEANPQATASWDLRLLDEWSNQVVEAVPKFVEPNRWGADGGSIQVMAGAIVVRHTEEVQEKVADFFAETLPGQIVSSASASFPTIRLPAPGPQLDWPKEVDARASDIHARIEAALDKKCDAEFREETLAKAIDALGSSRRPWGGQRVHEFRGAGYFANRRRP